jgi:2-oxoglutarate dehydrogenase E1 component/2-oxoglutarate decarboxylase
VLLCTGKVYYDLAAHRQREQITDTAIVRVEQLHPLPAERIAEVVAAYPRATEFFWVQEEPQNMGAWSYMALRLPGVLPDGGRALRLRSRPASASPAPGSSAVHEQQQRHLVESSFAR